jgi:hypothetical protein
MLFAALLTAGAGPSAAPDGALEVTADDFRCISEMTPVRGFYVDNLQGDLEATLEVAESEDGGVYPPGTVIQLVPGEVMVKHPNGTEFSAGRVKVSQAEVVSKTGDKLGLGFAATFGWNEVKCISAATLDLNSKGAPKGSPTEEEFFLYHTEGVEASGFCIHFKLPHYVTFQSSLDAMRDAKAKPVKEPAE